MEDQRSIEQLENNYWKDIQFPSGLIERCHQFRKIPVKDLSVEQVRLLLGQDVGTVFLLDKALDILEADILADGDFYPGDLLNAVLNLNKAYWHKRPDLAARLNLLLQQKRSLIQEAGHKKLSREVERFLAEQCIPVR